MNVFKSILLGSAVGFLATSALAADLPTRKAAPVEYVRICDIYGAGFFYLPGTDTCLKVGGLALFQMRVYAPQRFQQGSLLANGIGGGVARSILTATGAPNAVAPSGVKSAKTRDALSTDMLARLELDARDQTAFGTLRTYLRVDSTYGSAAGSATGSLSGIQNTAQTPNAQRELTYVNKAFIQFAGFTAGRAQSMFDFYADAYNYESLRGSNTTTTLLAYTATFGGGFSATISAEDEVARRNLIGTTLGGLTAASAGGAFVNGVFVPQTGVQLGPRTSDTGGTRAPDIVGAIRVDQAWGAAQLSAAGHEIRAEDFAGGAGGNIGTLESSSNKYGFAVQGGVKINLPFIAAGDTLYLQAAYARGATGYLTGNNLSFIEGGDNQRHGGTGFAGGLNNSPGYDRRDFDCVFIATGRCQESQGINALAAYKHFWAPTVSQAVYGSYYSIYYGNASRLGGNVNANGSSNFTNTGVGSIGVGNVREFRVGSNLVWTPIKNFDIGVEGMYMRLHQDTPLGLTTVSATGVAAPNFTNNINQFEGRLRVQRAF